jgi:hypothetical protein
MQKSVRVKENNVKMLLSWLMKGYNHAGPSKKKHHHKVGCSTSKGAFLEHPTVPIRKDHVEKEVKTESSEK